MNHQAIWRRILVRLIGFLVVLICAGLIAGGVILYIQGTAAVRIKTAESVFTQEQAAGFLRLFLIPVLVLVVLLIVAALSGTKDTQVYSSAKGRGKAPILQPENIGAHRNLDRKHAWLILTLAAGLIAAGMINGGLREVLIKAINICTECIGLG